ncbi:MAG: hypothetical protein DMG81_06835, partial [Acidobacteria bacterium]
MLAGDGIGRFRTIGCGVLGIKRRNEACGLEGASMRGAAVKEDAGTSRLEWLEWDRITRELDTQGSTVLEGLLTREECRDLASHYGDDSWFRSRVVMASHGFGRGEYKYLRYPLPEVVAELRP